MEHFGQLAECSNLPTCGMAKFIQNWITITCFVNTTKEKSILFYHQNIQNKMEHQLADVSFMYILALSRRMLLLRASISFQLGIASINPVYRFPFPMILSTCFNHINTEFKKNISSVSSTIYIHGLWILLKIIMGNDLSQDARANCENRLHVNHTWTC